jgi:MFS family permease
MIFALVAFAMLSQIPEDYHPGHHHAEKKRWIPKSLIAPGVAIGFVNVHYPVVAGFLILHLQNYGNSGSAAFSAYALFILMSRFFLGGLPDRIHPAITFYGGIAAMAGGLLIIAGGPHDTMAVAATALLGFGFSFPWSSVASTVLRRTDVRERGSALSIISAFYDLFVGISSFAAGAIANRYGYSSAFVMAAASLTLAAVAGRYVFFAGQTADVPEEQYCETST